MTRLPRPRRRVPRRLASGQGTTPLDRKATIPSSLSGPASWRFPGRAAKKDALRRCITTMGHRHVRVRREPDRYAYLAATQGRISKNEALVTMSKHLAGPSTGAYDSRRRVNQTRHHRVMSLCEHRSSQQPTQQMGGTYDGGDFAPLRAKIPNSSLLRAADHTAGERAMPTFTDAGKVIEQNLEALRKPGILAVRPGYHIDGGWPVGDPVIVALVGAKKGEAAAYGLPSQVGGVPVEVREASPLERLKATQPSVQATLRERTRVEQHTPDFPFEHSF